jgi:hypothetical protein
MWWLVGYQVCACATFSWIGYRTLNDDQVELLGLIIVSLLWPLFWTAILTMHFLRIIGLVKPAKPHA